MPGVLALVAFALPVFDRAPLGLLRKRATQAAVVWAGVAGVVVLTVLALQDDAGDRAFRRARRRATARAERALVLAAGGVPPEGPLAMLRHDPLSRGPELFAEHCAPCHRLEGEGGDKASDLTGFGTRAWIEALIANPRDNRFFGHTRLRTMPAQTKIGAQGRRAVAEFLHAQGAAPAERVDEALRAEGVRIFTTRCTSCHLFNGEGRDVEDGPEMAGYGSAEWLRTQIRAPNADARYGERNEMVVFGPDRLTDDEVDMLVVYLRHQRSARF